MNVLFAGGGTGGHLYPAIALADALRGRAQIDFVGTADRLESRIVPENGYALHAIPASSLPRAMSLEAARAAARNVAGIAQASRLLTRLRPDLVIASGGYVSFPVVFAAKLLNLCGRLHATLALLEPNAQPGLTNRLLAPLVDETWGAFAHGAKIRRYYNTGIPVRASLFHARNRIEAARRLGLDPSRKTILVVGGSQGARRINDAVSALLTRRALPAQWQVLHLCGERDFEAVQIEQRALFGENSVVLLPYLSDMADAYAVSEIVIARAGASTLAELAALGIASVLVPYPFAADDHQSHNARVFERAGAAVVLADHLLDADLLWWTLRERMQPESLQSMREAARSLAAGDPVANVLARIDALCARTGAA